jgi:hypothetical protein
VLAEQHLDLLHRALEMEAALPNLTTIKGLGRHWSWRELVESSEAMVRSLPVAPPLTCTCVDGVE